VKRVGLGVTDSGQTRGVGLRSGVLPLDPTPRVRVSAGVARKACFEGTGAAGALGASVRQPAGHRLVEHGALPYTQGIEGALIEIPIGHQALRVLEPAQRLLRLRSHAAVNHPRIEPDDL
jgi:hypothetical protein